MNTVTNEVMKKIELYLYEEEKSRNTIEKYVRDIRFFCEWLQGKGIDKSVVIEYKKELCNMKALLCAVIPNIVLVAVFRNNNELKSLYAHAHEFFKRIRKNKSYT